MVRQDRPDAQSAGRGPVREKTAHFWLYAGREAVVSLARHVLITTPCQLRWRERHGAQL